jgi:hypothetical protein
LFLWKKLQRINVWRLERKRDVTLAHRNVRARPRGRGASIRITLTLDAKTKEVYGVDVSDIESAKLWKTLDRIVSRVA